MLKQHGLLTVAACENASEARGQKGTTRPLRQPPRNSPGDCKVGQPSLGGPSGQQRAHFGGGGELWWGWGIGSKGPPRALNPPTHSCKSGGPCATSKPARRAPTSQRHSEGHRHTEHPQPGCPDATLKSDIVPQEHRGLKTPGAKRHININFLLWLTSRNVSIGSLSWIGIGSKETGLARTAGKSEKH